MRTVFIRWVVLASAAALIAVSGSFGYASGMRAHAYMAFVKREYRQALGLYEQVGDASGCGMVMLALNCPDEAMAYFQRGNDRSGMGLCWAKKKEFRKALECFEAGRDHRGMGLTYLGLRQDRKAQECFAKADDWSGLGLVHLSRRDFMEARRCFGKVTDSSGLGITALKEGKIDEAQKHFARIGDQSGLGLVRLARRDFPGALACFRKVNDYSGMGKAYLRMGDEHRAEECFLRGYDYEGLGDLYSRLHQFEKAREMFTREYNALKVMQSWRSDYTLPDRRERAIAYGREAVTRGQMAPECLLEMADIYYEMKEIPNALAALAQAAGIPGWESEVHLARGRIYFYLRELERAREEFTQVRPDALSGEHLYREAQESLATIARYESSGAAGRLTPAQGY